MSWWSKCTNTLNRDYHTKIWSSFKTFEIQIVPVSARLKPNRAYDQIVPVWFNIY